MTGLRNTRFLAAAAVLAALAVVTSALPAAALRAGGNGTFGLTPAPNRNGYVAPYFMLTIPAGGSATRSAIISNPGSTLEQLKISRSTGITATNGGSAFSRAFHPCAGPGCWVTITPTLVTLRPNMGEALRVTVHVPPGTKPGQYLAGVTAESAAKPHSVAVGSRGAARAKAIITEQISLGVAVTVGSLSQLRSRLHIAGVTGSAIGPTARLNLLVKNTGQRFTHATGQATCTAAGRRRHYPVITDTILPHDSATIPVNAKGIPEGATVPCQVVLHYTGGMAHWTGTITVPAPPHVRVVHTGPGAYSVLPTSTNYMPWMMALLAAAVLILAMVLVLLMRRRRQHLPG